MKVLKRGERAVMIESDSGSYVVETITKGIAPRRYEFKHRHEAAGKFHILETVDWRRRISLGLKEGQPLEE